MRAEFITTSARETRELAAKLSASLQPGAVVALYGPLGAGKTEFVRGAARGLGVKDVVRSPGYSLVNEYQGRVPVFHVDLYRVESARQLETLALEEYLEAGGVTFLEWAEKAEDLLPDDAVHVRIAFGKMDGERRIIVEQVDTHRL